MSGIVGPQGNNLNGAILPIREILWLHTIHFRINFRSILVAAVNDLGHNLQISFEANGNTQVNNFGHAHSSFGDPNSKRSLTS
jgi:hypothetical protein